MLPALCPVVWPLRQEHAAQVLLLTTRTGSLPAVRSLSPTLWPCRPLSLLPSAKGLEEKGGPRGKKLGPSQPLSTLSSRPGTMASVAVKSANPFKNSQSIKRHYLLRNPQDKSSDLQTRDTSASRHGPCSGASALPGPERRQHAPLACSGAFPPALGMQRTGTTPSWGLTEEASDRGSRFLLS